MAARGIAYVSFGKGYDQQCAGSARSVRKYVDYPITVITNLTESAPMWKEVSNVTFIRLPDWPDYINREAKTLLYKYVDYDLTLYMDSDTVVVSNHFVNGFKAAEKNELTVVDYRIYKSRSHLHSANPANSRLCHEAGKYKLKYPIRWYMGGLFLPVICINE